ncbi:MAG: helix-turn-helix transcriptional regulator [Lachnospiraceae bacterium]|nr:helix-turn-helix transcriptional regulator [Lachnospiraceae bacterium]MDD3796662.1 helix-turn-helix transcriptional regulator [Lachnospiraceae bacterium]
MIKYTRLWETMKKKNISQYDLYTHYGINRSLLDRLRKNSNIEVYTIDRLCTILKCRVEDIMEYISEESKE